MVNLMIDDLDLNCPHCGEELEPPVEMEAGDHNYIDECESCENPLEFNFVSNGEDIFDINILALE